MIILQFLFVGRNTNENFQNFQNIALNVTDDRQKKALLLNYIGEEAYEVYENLINRAEDETH